MQIIIAEIFRNCWIQSAILIQNIKVIYALLFIWNLRDILVSPGLFTTATDPTDSDSEKYILKTGLFDKLSECIPHPC